MEAKKEKMLAQIYEMMRQEDLTVDDVKNYALKRNQFSHEFDLLCLINGTKKRVSFSFRHLGEPIGIFPFKNKPEYIELDEVENKRHIDDDVDEKRLLDERFCSRVYKIKDRLNVYLKALGKPILDGCYLADSSYMRGCGWVVGFEDNGTGNLSSDYYGGSMLAKLRYMGKFVDTKTY